MTFAVVMPFLAVALGIALWTFGPFLVKALTEMKETGEWPDFDVQYLVSPLAAFLLDVVAFVILLLTSPGMLAEIAGLEFVLAVLVGYGGTDALRDIQKALILAFSYRAPR